MTINKILEKDGKWFVYSKDGKKKLAGPYDSKGEAQERLEEIESFKKNQFCAVTANFIPAKKLRYDTLEGRDCMVVPTVMIVKGVLNGSNGPLLYPDEELEKTPQVWDHKPIVVYHPEMNGLPVSACNKSILETRKVGIMLNTRYEKGKLKTESWLDPEKLKKVDLRVYDALQNGEKVEVSTGLFSDMEETEGEFEGITYNGIARNYRPDHLAILPDIKGACPIEKGAGLLQNSDPSFEAIRGKIEGLLREKDGNGGVLSWVESTYPKFAIYSMGDKYYKVGYSVDEEGNVTLGEKVEVERKVEYVPVTNEGEGGSMNKEQVVKEIIANAKGVWSDKDKDTLMAMSDKQLTALQNSLKVDSPEPKPKDPEPKKEEPVANKQKLVSLKEFIDSAPVEIRAVLVNGLNTYNEQKSYLIGLLTANERNPYTNEELVAMDIDSLKKLIKLAKVEDEKKDETFSVNFAGLAPVGNVKMDEEPLLIPDLVSAK